MMRRSLMRVAAVATGAFLMWGGSSLRAAQSASAALPLSSSAEAPPIVVGTTIGSGTAPSIGVEYAANYAPGAVTPGRAPGGDTVTANAADGVATIPLPPSAYPGMVGLATAALSVWRYRRRRRR